MGKHLLLNYARCEETVQKNIESWWRCDLFEEWIMINPAIDSTSLVAIIGASAALCILILTLIDVKEFL